MTDHLCRPKNLQSNRAPTRLFRGWGGLSCFRQMVTSPSIAAVPVRYHGRPEAVERFKQQMQGSRQAGGYGPPAAYGSRAAYGPPAVYGPPAAYGRSARLLFAGWPTPTPRKGGWLLFFVARNSLWQYFLNFFLGLEAVPVAYSEVIDLI